MMKPENFVKVSEIVTEFIDSGGFFTLDKLVSIINAKTEGFTMTCSGLIFFLGIDCIYEDMIFYRHRGAIPPYAPCNYNMGAFLLYGCKERSKVQAQDVIEALVKIQKFYELNESPS